MPHHTSDTRVTGYEPLLAPAALLDELPLGASRETTVDLDEPDVTLPSKRLSPAAAKYLNIEIPNLLAQRVAVDAEQIGGSDLVAARSCQGD